MLGYKFLYIIIITFTPILSLWSQQLAVDCTFIKDGYNEHLKAYEIDTKLFPFVEFFPLKSTPDKLYTTPNILIGLSKINDNFFINLKIVFNHYSINNYPGFLPAKSQIIFHFISGEHLVLLNINDANGHKSDDKLIYNATYFVPEEDIEVYKTKDIDFISINWSTEGQTYETYQVDVLRRIFECFN